MTRHGNSRLTGPTQEKVLEALRNGCTRAAASGYAGISRMTLHRWMQDGTFRDEVEKAEDYAEAKITSVILQSMPKNWTAAAWWLERRKWQDYGRHDRVEMTLDLRREAEAIAAKLGVSADDIMAEAEAIAVGAWDK